jgi:FKBP-type peptidyl-prolyl cis-trans isomerase FkpA
MSVTAVPLQPLKKGSVVKLWLAIILLSLGAAALAWSGTNGFQFTTTPSGLQYQVVKEGEGTSPTENDVAVIDYTGRLMDGTVFDSTQGKQPVPMPVGGSIPGFSEGLKLMQKGATYKFRIPPELAYGEKGAGGVIPPNATLEFEVTLHEFVSLETYMQLMSQAQGVPQP